MVTSVSIPTWMAGADVQRVGCDCTDPVAAVVRFTRGDFTARPTILSDAINAGPERSFASASPVAADLSTIICRVCHCNLVVCARLSVYHTQRRAVLLVFRSIAKLTVTELSSKTLAVGVARV